MSNTPAGSACVIAAETAAGLSSCLTPYHRWHSRRNRIDQAIRPMHAEPHHPTPLRLTIHPIEYRHKPSCLRNVFRVFRKPP